MGKETLRDLADKPFFYRKGQILPNELEAFYPPQKRHRKCLKQCQKKVSGIMKKKLSKAAFITSSFRFSLGLQKKILPILHLCICGSHKGRKAVSEQNDNNKPFF